MTTSRVFAAVPIPKDIAKEIDSQLATVRRQFAGLRWTAADQYHVTIEFFGDVDNRELPRICQSLGETTRGLAPFQLSFGELGSFPSGKLPRVLWLGTGEGEGSGRSELTQIHQGLREQLSDLATAGTAKAYVPHLTLARLSKKQTEQIGPELLNEMAASHELNVAFEVRKLALYASFKDQGTVVHDPVCTQPLS